MTRGRPARPDEIPRYGSVWVYGTAGLCYFVLGVTSAGWLLSVRIEKGFEPEINDSMIWRHAQARGVMARWRCIDEGPE